MLAYTTKCALASVYLDEYAVSSDDPAILEVARECGVKHVIERPPHLAQDETPQLPALQHAVEVMEARLGREFDYVADIRATSPFKTVGHLDGILTRLLSSGADSVIGVCELSGHHPARAKRLDGKGRLRDFCYAEPASFRRQDLSPAAYVRNGTVYAYRREALMGPAGRMAGHDFSLPYRMLEEFSVNVDTELDWRVAEALMESLAWA